MARNQIEIVITQFMKERKNYNENYQMQLFMEETD
jgi:ATP:corrinoid adenosyltransferase